jgi:hypothetical protein
MAERGGRQRDPLREKFCVRSVKAVQDVRAASAQADAAPLRANVR